MGWKGHSQKLSGMEIGIDHNIYIYMQICTVVLLGRFQTWNVYCASMCFTDLSVMSNIQPSGPCPTMGHFLQQVLRWTCWTSIGLGNHQSLVRGKQVLQHVTTVFVKTCPDLSGSCPNRRTNGQDMATTTGSAAGQNRGGPHSNKNQNDWRMWMLPQHHPHNYGETYPICSMYSICSYYLPTWVKF